MDSKAKELKASTDEAAPVEPFVMSASQGAAAGALRCAIACIDEAQRQLETHYLNNCDLNRAEYLSKSHEINNLRISACDELKPFWIHIEA